MGERMRRITILILTLLFFAGVGYASDNSSFKVSQIPEIQKQALKKYKHINTQNKYSKQMQEVGKQAYQTYTNNKKMQTMLNTYENNILSTKQFKAAFKKYAPGWFQKGKKRISFSRIGAHDKLFIFISSSMPMSEIRRYVQQVALINEPDVQIVIRGFVDGVKYLKPTIRFFYKAAKIDPNCEGLTNCKFYNVSIDVNPLPFRKYHIERVPAFVFDPNFQKITKTNINDNDSAYKLYGDVSLEYAIKVLYENSRYIRLKEFLDKLKSKAFYR
ncbi:type-F conjugative transfer system pilin assembly protein TrbC [Hippea maritima]|uniref:Type-F conjugative transfer system pilin assembly protein TrbC n=1 Tax=Hippea maritima (strain ATCC 700847 / DSM 10411 / MH2) TaxID=760142 RepID=F2LV37_HIPMA|nr:type-F conjugative transfer system pilin assembly protein TrbC [Hippea maritima]AEA33621.1 Type-F conjugative transfer system pilin assembly protein TrbC [Hippea maritima DSM 10411]